MNISKRAITPIISVSLLLIITILSVISFTTWYNSFSTDLFSNKLNTNSQGSSYLSIEGVFDNILYVSNPYNSNFSYKNIIISGVNCNISGSEDNQLVEINIKSCISELTESVNDIIVVTDNNIISKTVFIEKEDIEKSKKINPVLFISSYGNSGLFDETSGEITIDSSNNLYITGSTRSNLSFSSSLNITNQGSTDFFLVKIDSSGTPLYIKSSENNSGSSTDSATGIALDSNENIYISGFSRGEIEFGNGVSMPYGESGGNCYVTKYSNSGVALFSVVTHQSGNFFDICREVAVDKNDDSFFFGGASYGNLDFGNGITLSNEGQEDFFIAKYNSSGSALWAKSSTMGSGSGYDAGYGVSVDNFGNSYAYGRTGSDINFGEGFLTTNSGGYDFFLSKYNSSGEVQQVYTDFSNATLYDSATEVRIDQVGNVYLLGSTESPINFGNNVKIPQPTSRTFYLVKYNSSGVAQFAYSNIPESGGSSTPALELGSDGSIYIGGSTSDNLDFGNGINITNAGERDFFIVKLNNLGVAQNVISSSEFGGVGDEYITDLVIDENYIYVYGTTTGNLNFGNIGSLTNNGGTDLFIIKFEE